MEVGLVRVLQSQIAMTPRGTYRTGLEKHLGETQAHAERVQARVSELEPGGNPFWPASDSRRACSARRWRCGRRRWTWCAGRAARRRSSRTPRTRARPRRWRSRPTRRSSTWRTRSATTTTAKLAASIRADEERMLDRVVRELPKLARAVVRSEVDGDPSYDVTETGAADVVRETAAASKRTARRAKASTKRTARQTRKVPGVARAEGQVKGALASEGDLAIAGYDKLTAEEIVSKLAELSQIELAKVKAYERKHDDRSTVLARITRAAGCRAVARLRRADRRGDPRGRRRRRRAREQRAQLRARAQEPRRRAQRRRARARNRLGPLWEAPPGAPPPASIRSA